MFADTHVHLASFSATAVPTLIERARAAGVSFILTMASDVASAEAGIALAEAFPEVYAAVGTHPMRIQIQDLAATLEAYERLARRHDKVIAIGEVGLDSHGPASLAEQVTVLRAEFRLARRLGLPVNVHVVGAEQTALDVIEEERAAEHGVIIHYFTGDVDLAGRYLAAGCTLSVGRPVLKQGYDHLREAVKAVPLDRLLLETDAYPLPGRMTEPKDVVALAEYVAVLKGVSVETVAREQARTLRRLFRRLPPLLP